MAKSYRYLLFIAACLLPLSPLQSATVYKCMDKDGTVHYTQHPVCDSPEKMSVSSSRPGGGAGISQPGEIKKEEGNQKKTAAEQKYKAAIAAKNKEITAKNKEIAKENCKRANQRLRSINHGGRLFEVTEDGERSYWDDTKRQAELAKAQEGINKWCVEAE